MTGLGERRANQPRRGRARPLTGDDVVEAGLRLLDERGLSGFTMRSLAEGLGTYPATVYWHVGNRAQLLARVVDRVLAEIEVPGPGRLAWQEWLASLAREYRRVMHRHPQVASLVGSQLLVSPPSMRLVETVLAVLAEAGISGPALAGAFNAFAGSVIGWVAVELCAAPADAAEGWQDDYARTVRGVQAAEYPVIAANLDHLAGQVIALRWQGGAQQPMDEGFEAALRMWIAGVAALRQGTGG
jgi:TetR/AcrR family transcriptional regulator, tetracycline repressor protein